jgi:hypothetical protein
MIKNYIEEYGLSFLQAIDVFFISISTRVRAISIMQFCWAINRCGDLEIMLP